MWNDTDTPLAYLITFRCYGTWLHGDERGSVDRFHHQYRAPRIPANENWQRYNRRKLKGEPVILNSEQRQSVEEAIREVCSFRHWLLHAVSVRTNHVHAVVAIGSASPERALNDFKAYATRGMRQNDCWHSEGSPWVDKGS
jgi:transposase IS200 family protein